MTNNKGWGLRCLDDIPKGAFICTYTGHLLTEKCAEVRGHELGDEYFAELDFIRTIRDMVSGKNDTSDTEWVQASTSRQYDEEDSDDENQISLPSKQQRRTKKSSRAKNKGKLVCWNHSILDFEKT